MKVYISGKITGDPDYAAKFAAAEQKLTEAGYQVFNPTCLPVIFTYDQFMELDLLALSFCDAIYMLPNWEESKGAKQELCKAMELGLQIWN